MTSYQSEKKKILDEIADIGRGWIHDQLDGTSFIKDELDAVDKAVAEASHAIDELVKTMVIGGDEKASICEECRGEEYCHHGIRDWLRASQRQVMEKGEDDE